MYHVCILSLKHKKKSLKVYFLGGGMRSACYWLPYLAYPTLHCTALYCTAQHSIQSPKSRSTLKNTCSKEIPTYQYTRSCTCTHYIYIYTYIIHTRMYKRITLCLTLIPSYTYLTYLTCPIQKQVGRFPYSSLLPDDIYYTTTLLYLYNKVV